jgi:hypothetical protein
VVRLTGPFLRFRSWDVRSGKRCFSSGAHYGCAVRPVTGVPSFAHGFGCAPNAQLAVFFVLVFLAAVVITWPSPPWRLLQYGGIVPMILAPIILFPFSKTLFLALTCCSDRPRETS